MSSCISQRALARIFILIFSLVLLLSFLGHQTNFIRVLPLRRDKDITTADIPEQTVLSHDHSIGAPLRDVQNRTLGVRIPPTFSHMTNDLPVPENLRYIDAPSHGQEGLPNAHGSHNRHRHHIRRRRQRQ